MSKREGLAKRASEKPVRAKALFQPVELEEFLDDQGGILDRAATELRTAADKLEELNTFRPTLNREALLEKASETRIRIAQASGALQNATQAAGVFECAALVVETSAPLPAHPAASAPNRKRR